MSRPLYKWTAIFQIGLVLFSGCHPTQPFFIARDDSLANYVAQSMEIEYADVQIDSLPEATQAAIPLGPDQLPDSFVDLTLEDCISMALQNTKIIRVVNGSNLQSGSVASSLVSAPPGQMPSIYDPATVATTANSQPLAIDGQGNRIAPRGSIRSNQVGGVEDALSEFDAQFSALFGYNTTDRPRNVGQGNIFNPQFFQGVDANSQAALSKRMATGSIATARFSTIYSYNNIPPSGNVPPDINNPNARNFGRAVPSDYTSTIDLTFTQPLLRGRGTLVNRIPIVLARINEDMELHQFEGNIRNLVRDVEHAYWDLYCGYRAFESAKIAQATALDLWRVAHARTQLGDTPPEAEAQARALYAQFHSQVHTSLYGSRVPGNDPGGLYGREQTLREKIGWSATDTRLIRPKDDPTVARVQFDWNGIQGEALNRNTDLRRQKWAIKQRELELINAENQVLPQLDLTAGYRFVGIGDRFAANDRNGLNFPDPGSTALEELTGGKYQEVTAQVQYTPQAIGKRRAMANIQNARIGLVKFREELREKENLVVHEISRAWRDLESSYISMKDFLDQWQANEDEIKIYADKIKTDVGELSQLMDNLLRSEEKRARAQLQYYQSVCEYNKSMVNIHYLKGSVLDLNSIRLEEGPWMDKAYWDAEERASERASGIYFDYGYTRPAVVSSGPVESGGQTEGNLSTPGFTYDATGVDELLEPTPAEELDTLDNLDSDDSDVPGLSPLPERDGPTAQLPNVLRSLRTSSQDAANGAPVVQASDVRPGKQFDWGSMGLDDANEPAPVVSNPQARPIVPAQAQRPVRGMGSGGPTVSPDETRNGNQRTSNESQWRSR